MTESNDHRPTLVVIVGPTGSGKTDLSIALAEYFNAPVISTDSRQVFKGMAIGTAQPSSEQLAKVRHYFIAEKDITEHYTAGRYEKEAIELLGELFKEHHVVIAVGGSGLYVNALCNGMDALPKSDPRLRASLLERLENEGLPSLLDELFRLDPKYYNTVDRNNPNRVIRALEVCHQTGFPFSAQRTGEKSNRDFNIIKIGGVLPRAQLYERINRRVDIMMSDGLEKEARELYFHRGLNSLQTVGYREMFNFLDGKISKNEAVDLIKRNSRRYAKRQITWFGRDDEIKWFHPSETNEIIGYIENVISSR